jgi:hypothetical protein
MEFNQNSEDVSTCQIDNQSLASDASERCFPKFLIESL